MISTLCRRGSCYACTQPGCDHSCHAAPGQAAMFIDEPDTAANMNRVGSPTGRVDREMVATSVNAARKAGANTLREQVCAAVIANTGPWRKGGLTSIEVAVVIPQIKVSNRAASRLGELWEEGRVAILREHGVCELGVCHPHHKPGTVHRPTAACPLHGKAVTRGGASVWVST